MGWITSLNIGGLILNLIGTYFLFSSVMSSHYATESNPETKGEIPLALLKVNVAKKGIKIIFLGFLLQLISACLSMGQLGRWGRENDWRAHQDSQRS